MDKTTGLLFLINFVFVTVATYCRFCHAGRVCSGDFLYEGAPKDYEKIGFVNVEGMWL